MTEEIDVRSDEMIASRRGDADALPSDMPVWMQKWIRTIDTISVRFGVLLSWLTVPLMLSMVYEVVARYLFTAPTVWAYDISRMLYGEIGRAHV